MSLLFRDVAGPSLAPGGSVLCVGAFDGVHVGHRALLARVRDRARQQGLMPLAISFEPVPREFFARGVPVPRLTSAREKIERLFEAGIDRLLLLRFNAALAEMAAERFIEDVLVARAGARAIWVGADFRFGHARRGDVAMLRAHADRCGFAVEVMPDVEVGGCRASSSEIRERLAAGSFDAAAHLLGRRFAIGGHVVRGRQLGRTLGYPTANIRLGRRAAPIGGIFAVRVRGAGIRTAQAGRRSEHSRSEWPEGQAAGAASHSGFGIRGERLLEKWPGVASLGVRPTIDGGGEPLLEVHLFDFDGDLYGRRIEVEFVQKLRDEEKFDDLDAMVRQIDRDAVEARAILGAHRSPDAAVHGAEPRRSPGRRAL
jgi:riboflavin kinase/FMN adenylyltransferase